MYILNKTIYTTRSNILAIYKHGFKAVSNNEYPHIFILYTELAC